MKRCPSGGTGIRDGLKIHCPLGCEGSNPSSGIRPHSYYVCIVPKLNKMGVDLQLYATEHGQDVDWKLILSELDRITRSDSDIPVEDFARWCTKVMAYIRRREACVK